MPALQFYPVGINKDHWYARQPDGSPAGYIKRIHKTFQVHLLQGDELGTDCIAYHATIGAAQRRLVRAFGRRFNT